MVLIMFLMLQNVLVGTNEIALPAIHSISIEKSWQTIADTATIRLPKVDVDTQKSLAEVLPEGTAIKIDLGYGFENKQYLNREFSGYIKRFHNTRPIKIELEDAAYLLRKKQVARHFKDATLIEVISYLVDGTGITLHADIPLINFKSLRITNVSAYGALQKLKEQYSLTAYFRDHTIYVGLAFTELLDDVTYQLNKNIRSEDLSYRQASTEAISLEAKAILPDNKVLKIEVGEKNGSRRNWTTYSAKDKASLKVLAEQELERMRKGKYEGGIKTWLLPYCTFGQTATIIDPDYPDKEGRFIVDKVVTSFSSSGGKRKIEIGKKVS